MNETLMIQEFSDKVQKEIKEKIDSVFTSQPGARLTRVNTEGRKINTVVISTLTEKHLIHIGAVRFRIRRAITKELDLIDTEERRSDLSSKISNNIKGLFEARISEFKASINSKNIELNFLIPDEQFQFFCYKDRCGRGPLKIVIDMEIRFGAYALVDDEDIVPYSWNEDGLDPEEVETREEITAILRLNSFVRKEKQITLSFGFNPEGYAEKVLERFRSISPSAILLFGDERTDSKDYVRCKIDGTWEFSISNPDISFEVKTNGQIHVSNSVFIKEIT